MIYSKTKKFLYWTPRILAIIFALFVGLFVLDVFENDFTLIKFLAHLVPAFIVVIALLISWKWERLGGSMFLMIGFFYLSMIYAVLSWIEYIMLAGPPILIGSLFVVHYYIKKKY